MRRSLAVGWLMLAGCQCLVPLEQAIDAGLDAGPDAGIDAGPDAGVDAGPDAGSDSGVDAGPHIGVDAGNEPCASSDGGRLTRLCPLTLGVCAGHYSSCVDGGFTACDYGPDYELTERRCDGLDNDCDGRVDKSWPRVLLDAGSPLPRAPWFSYADFEYPEAFIVDAGFAVSLPSMLLFLNDDLQVQRQTLFPQQEIAPRTRLLRDGQDWIRVSDSTYWRNPADVGCVELLRIRSDGVYAAGADGGPSFLASVCQPGGYPWSGFALAAADDGATTTVVYFTSTSGRTANLLTRLEVHRDGGYGQSTSDASAVDPGLLVGIEFHEGAWFLTGTALGGAWGGHVDRCNFDLSGCSALFSSAVGSVRVAQYSPLVVALPLGWWPSPDTQWQWQDGGSALSPLPGYWVAPPLNDASRVFGLRAIVDGGYGGSYDLEMRLVALTAAGETVVETLVGIPQIADAAAVVRVRDSLYLFIYGEGGSAGTYPAWNADRLNAEYVCIPP